MFIKKNILIEIGFNESTASEIIRSVKIQLFREGLELYGNPRIAFIPIDRTIEFLIGVSEKEISYHEIVNFLQNEIVHRNELIEWGIPKETASQLIKHAQQIMADEGYIFYQNTRRWFAPMKIIKQLLGGK